MSNDLHVCSISSQDAEYMQIHICRLKKHGVT